MILLKESFIYQLWLWLLAAYEASTVHRCLAACGAWCNRQIDGSEAFCAGRAPWPGLGRIACSAAS